MKEQLEKILGNGKKLLAGVGLVSLLSMPAVIGCEAGEIAYKCSCPATNEQWGASGGVCASTTREAEEKFGEEHGCEGVTCYRFPENDYLCR